MSGRELVSIIQTGGHQAENPFGRNRSPNSIGLRAVEPTFDFSSLLAISDNLTILAAIA
jgi:hypothetical protein